MDRRRHNPFRLLAILQFGDHPDIFEVGYYGEIIVLSLARLGRLIRVPSQRVVENLSWLEKQGLLTLQERFNQGKSMRLQLVVPPNLGATRD